MTEWMVTTNVGGGFGGEPRHRGMIAWAQSALDRSPALVFAQEVPSAEWLDVWTGAGYCVTLGPDRGWKVRSALISRGELELAPLDHVNASYHGSYVAGAEVLTRSGPLIAVSVHASPQKADPVKYGWQGDTPEPRHGGHDPRYTARVLWDSDLVLSTIASLAARGKPLIAAGDLNEALAYDADPATGTIGTWAREYFDRMPAAGLYDALSTSWGGERATRGDLQLDRVVVNEAGGTLLSAENAEIDTAWSLPEAAEQLSDHAAVWVALDESVWRT